MMGPLTHRLTIALMVLSVAAVRIDAQAQWVAHVNRDGGITVSMPCAPAWKEAKTERAGVKAAYTSHISICNAGDETYLIGWVDYEAGYRPQTEGELNANRDNLLKALPDAQLLTSTPATYQGLPALDFTARMGAKHLTSRVVLQGFRPFQLVIVTPLNADRAQNISRFLDSFRVSAK